MTRIIAGTARGRRLAVPPAGTRPTTDRVRESLFSTLEHRLGGFSGAAVLDLYAGSGAVGLEAASRGASRVVLVEHDPRAAAVLRANVDALGFGASARTDPGAGPGGGFDGRLGACPGGGVGAGPATPPGAGVAHVLIRAVEVVLAAPPPAPELGQPAAFDLVFVDPPYSLDSRRLSAVLLGLLTPGWLAPDAWLVVERSSRDRDREGCLPAGTALVTSKTYGETTLYYAQV